MSRNDLHDRHGVDAQIRRCRKLAEAEGIEVVAEFTDDDTSAWSGKKRRPGYDDLLDRLPDVDVVIAWAPDRLTRRMVELVGLIDALDRHNVSVITVQGGTVDLSTAGGYEWQRRSLACWRSTSPS